LCKYGFYRRKYDAEKVLAAFSATLRTDIDLEDLCQQLLTVVQETMQPAHASLWLCQPARDLKKLSIQRMVQCHPGS